VRIDLIGLAPVSGGEHPHLRGQLRRHAGDGLAVMDQAVRQVPADAVAALHRPDPVRELTHRCPISAYPALSVPYLPAASTLACSSMTSIVAERLCGSIPMITPTVPPRLAR